MTYDVIIIGAGAAGMMAAIAAANMQVQERNAKVLLLDGREKIGAKILVAGGGRCNVTNEFVHPSRFHTESDPYGEMTFKGDGGKSFVGRVLRAFSPESTLRFFESLGVPLKLEETGKYFPVSDSARSVLNALLQAVDDSGAELCTGVLVEAISKTAHGYRLKCRDAIHRVSEPEGAADSDAIHRVSESEGAADSDAINRVSTIDCRALVICTGGLALPKSGSDGAGLRWAAQLRHRIVRTTPALTPLLCRNSPYAHLSGIALPVRLRLVGAWRAMPQSAAERGGMTRHAPSTEYEGSMLFTHTGYSGPVVLNISRHLARDKDATVHMRLLPQVQDGEEGAFWQEFVKRNSKKTLTNALQEYFPRRLAETLAAQALGKARLAPTVGQLSSEQQKAVRTALLDQPLKIDAVADYVKAEATAGGVALDEIEPATMMSKLHPGLFFAGEICDVDGWLGGYNFQWAWSSGTVAGRAAARWVLKL